MAEKYYFSTKDLVIIAILSCLGAVMSTYVGYIGKAFGQMTGIPYGGQLLSGLHICLSSWPNLLVARVAFNSFGCIYVFGFVSVFSLVSGAIFGGCLTFAIYKILQSSGIIVKKDEIKAGAQPK